MNRPAPDAVHLVDGTALLFRSYFAPNLTFIAPDGTEVGGVLGLSQVLARHVERHRPARLGVVFDAGMITFRNRISPDYKANRGLPPEDLVPQFDLALAACQALGARCFRVPDVEADDLLATLVARLRADRVLVSGDKDLVQCLGPGVWLMDEKKGTLMDAAAATARWGVPPDRWTTYQALMGDSTDNIAGVKGVGAKTAAALVTHLGDLDAIYGDLAAVAGVPVRGAKTLARKLEAGQEAARLALRLVTLKADVDDPSLEVRDADLDWAGPADDADALFDRLGFHAPLRKLRRLASEAAQRRG